MGLSKNCRDRDKSGKGNPNPMDSHHFPSKNAILEYPLLWTHPNQVDRPPPPDCPPVHPWSLAFLPPTVRHQSGLSQSIRAEVFTSESLDILILHQ